MYKTGNNKEAEGVERVAMKQEGRVWFTLVGIGTEGPEILVSTKDKEEVDKLLPKIELRTRFNAHRNIKLYAYLSPEEVTWEKLKDKKYLKLLRTLKGGLK